jgi:hypothetical protein
MSRGAGAPLAGMRPAKTSPDPTAVCLPDAFGSEARV